jgi:UDP-GlcNAc:undecaprenyl-phosphate GlcNAc-1-phosphate transferase
LEKLELLGIGCLYLAAGFLCTKVWLHGIKGICSKRLQRINYLGHSIPTAMGLSISLAIGTVLCFQPKSVWNHFDSVGLEAVWLATTIGMLDDITNEKEVKGLISHFKYAIRHFELTAGSLKAIILTLGSIWLAREVEPATYRWLTGAAIIALFTNFVNLLDLRPGRAIKMSSLVFVLVLTSILWVPQSDGALSSENFVFPSWFENIPAVLKWAALLFGCLIAYAPHDFRGNMMLGDTGANMIGMIQGFLVVQTASYPTQIGVLVLLLVIHVFAERYSLSKTIEAIPFLKVVDRLWVTSGHDVSEQAEARLQAESMQDLPQS